MVQILNCNDILYIIMILLKGKLMNDIILEFLEAYKSLDELCKQILASNRGISEYIDAMNTEQRGKRVIASWEKDYAQLKQLRWKRNRLVHEINSFEDNVVGIEDVEWLKNFRTRIIERTDPFSLLYQFINNQKTETVKREKCAENEPQKNSAENDRETRESSRQSDLFIRVFLVCGIVGFAALIIYHIFANY